MAFIQTIPESEATGKVREIYERLTEATKGRYDITRELGRGGMAIVFLGYQQSLERQIAIKVLLPFLAYDTELVERFLREARTQGKLDHPSIIKVYEVHSEGGLTFFTMQDELSKMLGRSVDLNTPQCLSKYYREEILKEAEDLHVAA